VTLAIDPYLTGWLDLVFRWLHVIAAVVWIGTSFYFVALDNHLLPPERRRDAEDGVGGESWEVHGGGFYLVQKYRVAPRLLPEPLHWFKWEAYTTWLSGLALMLVLYYLNADTYLVDPSVLDLSVGAAVGISIALLVVAWIAYDGLCRLLEGSEIALAASLIGLVTLGAWACGELFAPRAAYLQVGAMLGTIMFANVFFVIIPAHWGLVRAKEAGLEPDPAPGLRANQRSVHNNYLTLPVLFAMIAIHFPFTYGHSYAWLILVVIMAVGAWIRLFFNLRHQGRNVWAIPITAASALVVLAFVLEPDSGGGSTTGRTVPFSAARRIVEQRCQPCHSAQPSNPQFTSAPAGVELDTPDQIKQRAEQIRAQAVDSTAMPLGNVTGMTDTERALLGRWISQGATVK
jgi:uncharacterized membrane protein